MKILLIEDDQDIVTMLQQALIEHHLLIAKTLEKGNELVQYADLVLLDLQLPDGYGLDFIQKIRKDCMTPIIVLTVINQEEVITTALDLGADDFITKPFSIAILKSRINNIVRRVYGNSEMVNQVGDLRIDLNLQRITKNNETVELTNNEIKVLFALVKANGRILTRKYLIENYLDHDENYVGDNALTVTIQRIKKKIGKEYIHTKRGIGYYFGEKVYEEKI